MLESGKSRKVVKAAAECDVNLAVALLSRICPDGIVTTIEFIRVN